MKYDYLVVGTGLFGAIFAHEAKKNKKKCLVIDKRSHIGGNIYTEKIHEINVHKYGPHIFHTDNKNLWEYINQFSEFNNFILMPVANYKGEIYNLPFNMNTFYRLWGTITPKEAIDKINSQIDFDSSVISNLEEQAVSLVGRDIYEKLIKGYTEKQWGRPCNQLPSFIINRIPLRFTYDNNYFKDRYQGIPVGGYTKIIEKMLEGIDVQLNTDYCKVYKNNSDIANKVIYTGMIDEYFDYQYGKLQYRTLRFEEELLDDTNYQGVSMMNYTEKEVPFTRIIEHKHFEFGVQEKTVITREYPGEWASGSEPYYPINDNKNNLLYKQYLSLSKSKNNIIFGGRLGSYQYMNMDQTIEKALELAAMEL